MYRVKSGPIFSPGLYYYKVENSGVTLNDVSSHVADGENEDGWAVLQISPYRAVSNLCHVRAIVRV